MKLLRLLYPFKTPRQPNPGVEQDSHPPSVADKNIADMIRLEQAAFNQRTPGERMADSIAAATTKAWFMLAHAFIFAVWIAVNTLGATRFDPRPYNFLNTLISIEAIFLTLLVLASQHRMARVSDRRAHLNLQVDLLAEQEMTIVLRMLEGLYQHFQLPPVSGAAQSAEMRKMTDIEGLANKIASETGE